MTTYNVQIKTESGYETHSKVSSKRKADTVVRDLCSAGIQEGRVLTDNGHESQSWQIVTPCKFKVSVVRMQFAWRLSRMSDFKRNIQAVSTRCHRSTPFVIRITAWTIWLKPAWRQPMETADAE